MQAGGLRLVARGKRLEAANINGIDGDIGFDGGGGGGAECGLIIHAGLAYTVAEINQTFLLRNGAEGLHDGLQSEEFAIGAEGVVVGVVGRVGAASFRGTFGRAGGTIFETLAFAGIVGGELRENFGAIGSEIEIDFEIGGQGNHADEIGGFHAGVDVFLGGIDGTIDFVGLHGGEV